MMHALQIIPSVQFSDLQKGLSEQRISQIRESGVVIVRGGVPREVTLFPLVAHPLSSIHMTLLGGPGLETVTEGLH